MSLIVLNRPEIIRNQPARRMAEFSLKRRKEPRIRETRERIRGMNQFLMDAEWSLILRLMRERAQ